MSIINSFLLGVFQFGPYPRQLAGQPLLVRARPALAGQSIKSDSQSRFVSKSHLLYGET
jgi:hypothetical protein